MKLNGHNKKAFTLIELLVVVAIIGILAAVGVVAYNGYTASAKVGVVKTHFKMITKKTTEVATLCEVGNSVKLMNVWGNSSVNEVTCYNKSLMWFFQNDVNNDLYNSGAVVKDAYYNEGVWQRNGKSNSGYAPQCEIDRQVGKVYAVYPAGTNNIEFCACFKTPCSDTANRLQDTLTVR